MQSDIFTVVKEFILNVAKNVRPAMEEYFLDMVKKARPALESAVIEEVKRLLEDAEKFLKGDTFSEAKVKLVNKAFEKIDLPLVVKPFKGLLKKIVSKKIDSTLEALLKDFKEKIAKKSN